MCQCTPDDLASYFKEVQIVSEAGSAPWDSKYRKDHKLFFDLGFTFFYDFSANFSSALTHLWDIIQYGY